MLSWSCSSAILLNPTGLQSFDILLSSSQSQIMARFGEWFIATRKKRRVGVKKKKKARKDLNKGAESKGILQNTQLKGNLSWREACVKPSALSVSSESTPTSGARISRPQRVAPHRREEWSIRDKNYKRRKRCERLRGWDEAGDKKWAASDFQNQRFRCSTCNLGVRQGWAVFLIMHLCLW